MAVFSQGRNNDSAAAPPPVRPEEVSLFMKRSSSGEENSDVSDLLFPSLVLQPGVNKCIFDIPTDGETRACHWEVFCVSSFLSRNQEPCYPTINITNLEEMNIIAAQRAMGKLRAERLRGQRALVSDNSFLHRQPQAVGD